MDNNENSPVAPDKIEQDFAVVGLEPEQSAAVNNNQEGKKSKAPLIIAIIAVLLLCGGGVTVFLLRDSIFGGRSNSADDDKNIQPVSDLPAVETPLSDFDLTFLKLNNTAENKVYSPLSIKYALKMLSDGAKGETKEEIDKLVGDYKAKAYLNSKNRSLANALFVRTSQKNNILDSYIEGLQTNYAASVVYDDFTSAATINKWVSEKTLNIIEKIVDDSEVASLDYALVNALAIDMGWKYNLQCGYDKNNNGAKNKRYNVHFKHENYSDYIACDGGNYPLGFSGDGATSVEVNAAKIGASINKYDIVKDLGEDAIRATVKKKYEEQKRGYSPIYIDDMDKYLDTYVDELKSNYGKVEESTDFYMYTDDSVKVFAKDLQEYDGSTLQYIGIMPTKQKLAEYIEASDAKSITETISKLYSIKKENFKNGVITQVTGAIPFFKYDYDLKLKDNLKELGVNKAFDPKEADLSNLSKTKGVYVADAKHKADIEFSDGGIKAAAVTYIGLGTAGIGESEFDYEFDVPIEKIDLTFDKPYLYIIRDKQTGEVWFTGTVYAPEAHVYRSIY